MLRAVVGLFLVLVLGTALSNGVPTGDRHAFGCDQARPSVLTHALALESELETGLDDLADPPFSDAIPEMSAIGRLVTGRRDLKSTHLEALLTCGRLLI
ncbi:hypothetical protein Pan44_53990 [Caulifigura coniformis]|uniref:Uncharacterized protein n=1 Tax=Caulifigura coniformis TaxID=2527983 RepID=A0A517SMI0_9PLAN|nr:hypothetical protein [Caulifigura coniformis]QDT57331.1 hypothetical protein Pan44_53990 [Caulifigura coniformis]